MAKLKAPLLSLGASGQLGKALVYFPWKGLDVVREYVVPANPQSAPQVTQRGYMTFAVAMWHTQAYTAADVIAWNRYAGTLAAIMSGFNAMVMLAIAAQAAAISWNLISDVVVDTPTAVGFDVDVENSEAGRPLYARIGTSRTHFPVTVALVDDGDGTYSLTWGAGASGLDYYVMVMEWVAPGYHQRSGIFHIKSG